MVSLWFPWGEIPQSICIPPQILRDYWEPERMKVTQLCPTLCDPVDCTVHGILQARILEWVAFPSSSQPRDWTQVSCIASRFFTSWATREAWESEKDTTIPVEYESQKCGCEIAMCFLGHRSRTWSKELGPPVWLEAKSSDCSCPWLYSKNYKEWTSASTLLFFDLKRKSFCEMRLTWLGVDG